MAKKSKFAFNFKEFSALAERLENVGGNLEKACEDALLATHDLITPQLDSGIARHVQTGETQGSLERAPRVEWIHPMKAQVNIGFDLADGGWPSIFLMWGTPKMAPDTALKNAAFGPKIRRQVAEVQRETLEAVIRELTRG